MLFKAAIHNLAFLVQHYPRAAIHNLTFLNAIQGQPFASLATAGADGGGIGADKGGTPGLPATLPPAAPGRCPAHLQTPNHPKVQGELDRLGSKNTSIVPLLAAG